MANPWFKFYAGDYLTDPKITQLSASERSCWLSLLCYANEGNGDIKYLDEKALMVIAGVPVDGKEWETTKGILKKLETLGMIRNDNEMITIINWRKRQGTPLTPYERVKRHRDRNDNDNDDSPMITNDNENHSLSLSSSRLSNNSKDTKRERKVKYLSDIPEEDIKEFTAKYLVTEKQLKSKAEDLLNYCQSKGKQYKDYKAFLRNAVKKDFGEREEKGGKYKGL